MTGEKRPPVGRSARRRRAPTIDLQATEVAAEPAAAEPAQNAAPEPAPPAHVPPGEPFIPPPPVKPAHLAFEPPPPEEPRELPRDEPQEPPPRSFAWLPPGIPWPVVGVAGTVGVLLTLVLLWLVAPSGREPAPDLSPRLAAIEAQLRALAARSMPAGVDPKAVEDIAARVASLEQAQATPRPPVTDPVVLGRIGASESALKSLSDNVAGLSRHNDEIAAALRDMRARIDSMAASVNELSITARAAAVGSDRAVRLAVAAQALRTAVERGDPFTAELAVAKAFARDGQGLAAIEPFAATGIPGNAALASELSSLIQPMLRAAGSTPHDGGFLDRLQANAERLVRIRPIDEAPGSDPTTILARIEAKAAQLNVDGALAELANLPPSVRAPTQSWIDKAQARGKAIEATQRFAADAIAALKAAP